MSVDEFDPDIERLFAHTPAMPDAALFTASVEQRLRKGGRFRVGALALAGAVGGAVAIRESLTVNVDLGAAEGRGVVAGDAIGSGLQAASVNTQAMVQSSLDYLGLANLDLGVMGGMQLFWIAAAALVAIAAAGVVRLSQEV